jgi:methionine aminopeptidase
MVVKSNDEIELLRMNALIVSRTLAEVAKHIEPGVKTITLDKIAEDYIRPRGQSPGSKDTEDFREPCAFLSMKKLCMGYRVREFLKMVILFRSTVDVRKMASMAILPTLFR